MALNRIFESAKHYELAVASGVASGDPVFVGGMTGVALTDRDADGNATVDLGDDGPVYDLSVAGTNDAGDSAVAVGDAIFYTDGDTPKLNKKASGLFFGYALEAVGSGATATIRVKLAPNTSVGSLDLPAASVGAADLPDELVGFALAAGQDGGSDPTYAITGLGVGDTLLFVGHFTTAAAIATLADVTADFTVSAAAEISSVTDYSSDQLLVVWQKRA